MPWGQNFGWKVWKNGDGASENMLASQVDALIKSCRFAKLGNGTKYSTSWNKRVENKSWRGSEIGKETRKEKA
jgi:hypothetical protein